MRSWTRDERAMRGRPGSDREAPEALDWSAMVRELDGGVPVRWPAPGSRVALEGDRITTLGPFAVRFCDGEVDLDALLLSLRARFAREPDAFDARLHELLRFGHDPGCVEAMVRGAYAREGLAARVAETIIDDLQGAAALGTLFNIDIEHPFEQPGPAHARRRRVVGCVGVNLCGVSCANRRAGDDRGTVLGVRREHAMEADQMQPRTGNQRGESLHKFQG